MEPKDPGNPYNSKEIDIHYFVPAQVIMHLDHSADLPQDVLAEDIRNFLTDGNPDQPWKRELSPPLTDWYLRFPSGTGGSAFSIVRCPLVNQSASPEKLAKFLKDVYDLYQGKPVPIPSVSGLPIALRRLSPNWLLGSARHGGGTTSPGAWPKRAAAANRTWPRFDFLDIDSMNPPEAELGAGVHVAILDTAPSLHDLIEAYDYWREEDRRGFHPLAESLLRPDGPLKVYPATLEELRLTADYSIVGHRYEMADHGLFIAGIIHTIAQQANLHLYEVFDPYGMGCIETIARGLVKVLDLRNELISSGAPYRLVVNCSFGLDVTRDGQMDPGLPALLQDPFFLGEMRISFAEIIESLNQTDVIVVAAAGNDAREEMGSVIRPPARYPAAFPSVTGVGALPRDESIVSPAARPIETASYSNLADDPSDTGFVTLGGEPEVGKGVQGIYIGRFPRNIGPYPEKDPRITRAHIRYDPNEEGWAWWAGTSFATPIISGLVAAWWGSNLNQTASDVRAFLNASAPTHTTPYSEGKIRVNQA